MMKKLERFRVYPDQELKTDKPLNYTFDFHGSKLLFKKRDPENFPKLVP